MRKTADAATILQAACMIKQAKNILFDAGVLILDVLPLAKSSRVLGASNKMYGVLHSLESPWVTAVAREVGCMEREVPFDCPEKALAFFELPKS